MTYDPKVPAHHELVYVVRLRAHSQPKYGDVTSESLWPSFQAARREGMNVYAAIQRVCERHGYTLGTQSGLFHRVATMAEGQQTPLEH